MLDFRVFLRASKSPLRWSAIRARYLPSNSLNSLSTAYLLDSMDFPLKTTARMEAAYWFARSFSAWVEVSLRYSVTVQALNSL